MSRRDGIPLDELPGEEVSALYFKRAGLDVLKVKSLFEPHPWSARSVANTWGVVLVRYGAYARRSNADDRVVDATTGLVRRPGDEVAYRHFLPTPDEVTVINFDPSLLDIVPGLADMGGAFPVKAELDLAHRLLVRGLEGSPGGRVSEDAHEESVLGLLHQIARREPRRRGSRPRRSAEIARGRMVRDACELLHAEDDGLTLVEIGQRVGCSPYHLSRTFHQITGLTISRYRLRLRIHAALDRISAGDEDLSRIAAATGFSDHPHMTRSMVAHIGHVPSELRRLLQ